MEQIFQILNDLNITFDDLRRFVEHYGHTYQMADVYKEEEQ